MTAPSRPRRPSAPAATPPPRRRRRRRVLPCVLRSLLVLLPLAALGWVVLLSPYLAVDRVQVTGAERLSVEQVVAAAGVVPGTPLARVRGAAVTERVEALPAVSQVRVGRTWPGTLLLEVVERRPAAGVPVREGVQLLDAGGVPFAVEPGLPAGVPRLEVQAAGPDDPATLAALTVMSELPPEIGSTVAVLRAPSPSGVELELDDGRRVLWGGPGDAVSKAAAVQALLRLPGTVIDVSAPGVAVRS